jgi:hypothetical protein
LQQLYQTTPNAGYTYWPKWDSQSVYRFDFLTSSWLVQDTLEPYAQRFLFFSSLAHLPKGLGMFIIGGSDSNDNFS